ncbi:GUN4 domain-containing protein [Lyngbya sp. PCC 8106]|uniref:GUN4 domain-containing protein n=1 Tax=Lyngbya sp. (strain PCC 8106) TaxID=313612 RepID=UPI0000EA8CC3|nr:GUN4 domain-containing protein [Lyngbya sp. PCC 8106]EAW36228.1 serine/threonine kinase [Lyngbya sp. PCC 8106]
MINDTDVLKVDYSQLEELLRLGKWKEADYETAQVMLKAAKREKEGWLNIYEFKEFPCSNLQMIDQLWVKYSDGRFGFSVQREIYLEKCGGKLGEDYLWNVYEDGGVLNDFYDQVGWQDNKEIIYDYNELTFDISAPRGHLPFGFRWYITGEQRKSGCKRVYMGINPHFYSSDMIPKLIACNI